MKVSLNWLRDYVELPAGVPELADLLTRAGVEVEGVTSSGVAIPKVVVAQILESVQHPNADRLSVCKVDDGSGVPRQIVCGAKNYRVGDKVPLALPGAVLPGDFKIKVGKLRGVESEGMLCSAEELGLPKGEDGLLILPADAAAGAEISTLFPGDTVLDLEVTPNRPDLLSHTGIAREVGALTGRASTGAPTGTVIGRASAEPVNVATEKCPLYAMLVLTGVTVGPSPAWLRQKLEAVGLRSINNVVDVTNFVQLESGQPLHAFDAARLAGELRVREAAEGEEFAALDGRTYRLAAGDVVIADEKNVLALGGVMGGEGSGVTEATRDILLESAWFDPASVRRTSRRLGLMSDSSYRFERGVDPAGVAVASQRAAALILELAGGAAGDFRVGLSGGLSFGFDPTVFAEPLAGPFFARTVPLRPERLDALLGTAIASERVDCILSGFGLRKVSGGWDVPTFRPDLAREADLVEEVARVIGMEEIPARLRAQVAVPGEPDANYDFQMSVRRTLAGQGLHEARTSTLVTESLAGENAVRLRNPLGEDQAFLRTRLVPGLLAALAHNIRQGARSVALFEIGRTFHAAGREETVSAAFVLTGAAAPADWRGGSTRDFDWHDARGIFELFVAGDLTMRKVPALEPLALAAEVFSGDARVGVIGQLAPSAARAIDAQGAVLAGELSVDALRLLQSTPRYREIPRFPAVTRDLALVCPQELPYAEIARVLREAGEEFLAGFEPFDIFTDPTGARLPADRKSIAISLTFRAPGRTLNSEEVQTACERLQQKLKSELAVDLRE